MKSNTFFNIVVSLICSVLSACTSIVFGQNQANIWYFGYEAGLDFNSGAPVVLTNGVINQSEGCSSIADIYGSLLFYTDGMSVWNRMHQQMPNGFSLGGNASSTQSALIIQQPGSNNIYYIFTTDAQLGLHGFSYSLVDMNAAGGLGDVYLKNSQLLDSVTEKITAVNDAAGTGVWIITHGWDNADFLAYHLTAAGLNLLPVTSIAGPVVNLSSDNTIGYMKCDPHGKRLAEANWGTNEIYLMDFDNNTGIVSNPIQLNIPLGSYSAYGVEFSTSGQVLYASMAGNFDLFQWDLSSDSAATINTSRINLYPSHFGANMGGSLALAPDKKIYYTRTPCDYLGAINNPDIAGIGCNFTDSAIYLLGKHCIYGLPNLNQSLYNNSFSFSQTCFGDSTYFSIPNSAGLWAASWDFGDTASGAGNSSTFFSPAHLFTDTGIYNVQMISFSLTGSDTQFVSVSIHPLPVVNLGQDTSFCSGTSFTITAPAGYTSYLWQDGSSGSTFTATTAGVYFVTVSDGYNCSATDTIMLNVNPCNIPSINLMSSDTNFCEKHCIDFFDLSTNNPTSWQWLFPGADSTSSILQNPGNICYNSYGSFDVTLIACNAAGCDTLLLSGFINEYALPSAAITQSNDTLYASYGVTYQWWSVDSGIVTGATNSYYVPVKVGNYYVIITDSVGCQGTSNVITVTGVNEYNNHQAIQISPNPFLNILTVIINDNHITEITIYDITSRKLLQQKFTNSITLATEQLAKGMYIYEVSNIIGLIKKGKLVKD